MAGRKLKITDNSFAKMDFLCDNVSMMIENEFTSVIPSPIGHISISITDKGLNKISILNKKSDHVLPLHKGLNEIIKQINKYFEGSLTSFDIPLDMVGTEFQKAVWKETAKIPFGKTLTYGDIAKKIGRPGAVRAVGTALGKNPVCIVVPCHRVVPKSGGVGNYAYGVKVKRWLLEFEGRLS